MFRTLFEKYRQDREFRENIRRAVIILAVATVLAGTIEILSLLFQPEPITPNITPTSILVSTDTPEPTPTSILVPTDTPEPTLTYQPETPTPTPTVGSAGGHILSILDSCDDLFAEENFA